LFINGTETSDAVGYLPASLYGGGPLATNATSIEYGGETFGATSHPPMGSGAFAGAGAGKAAYQRNIYYYTKDTEIGQPALRASQRSAASYTIDLRESDDWGKFFWFGGPGNTLAPAG